jgi:hypothetical protein
MSTIFYPPSYQQLHAQNPHPVAQSHNHHGRSRRAPRLSASQNSHRQFRGAKNMKDMTVVEPPNITAFRARFEAGRSFDLDDDMEFCPNLLTFDERQSITSGSSDRSSLSSGSPESSPTQQQIQPQHLPPSVSVSSAAPAFMSAPNFAANNSHIKIHHPSPFRGRNPIPIVNPNTRIASPPSSVSPGVMQATTAARASNGW